MGIRTASVIWAATLGSEGDGPASTTLTLQAEAREIRSAITDPALPAPMISTSLCKMLLCPNLRLEGADVPLPHHAGPQAGAVGDVVQALQQEVADQTYRLGVVIDVPVSLHPVDNTVDDRRYQDDVS